MITACYKEKKIKVSNCSKDRTRDFQVNNAILSKVNAQVKAQRCPRAAPLPLLVVNPNSS